MRATAVGAAETGSVMVVSAPTSTTVLKEVVDAVGSTGEVYVNGGLRSGLDVLRVLAVEARAVMIGRPVLWGLVTGGQSGVAGHRHRHAHRGRVDSFLHNDSRAAADFAHRGKSSPLSPSRSCNEWSLHQRERC